MIQWRIVAGMVACALLISLPGKTAETLPTSGPAARDRDAEALVRELLEIRPEKERQVKCQLKMRDANGKRSHVLVQYAAIPGAESWKDVYETSGPAAGEQLTVIHRGVSPSQYVYRRKQENESTAPSTLQAAQANVPFAGSDFWLSDLGMEFLHWPDQRLVKDAKITMRNGRPCKVLESINPAPGAGSYGKVVSWIDSEYGGLIFARAYDVRGSLLKVFSLKGFKKIDGTVQVKEMEIRNEQADSRTVLEFLYD
jgi:hypothetical protein